MNSVEAIEKALKDLESVYTTNRGKLLSALEVVKSLPSTAPKLSLPMDVRVGKERHRALDLAGDPLSVSDAIKIIAKQIDTDIDASNVLAGMQKRFPRLAHGVEQTTVSSTLLKMMNRQRLLKRTIVGRSVNHLSVYQWIGNNSPKSNLKELSE